MDIASHQSLVSNPSLTGTVISIYREGGRKKQTIPFGLPILHRIRRDHTILRSSADASLLLQAILDYVVDDTMEVVDKYHQQILQLERQILIRPKMTTVRQCELRLERVSLLH